MSEYEQRKVKTRPPPPLCHMYGTVLEPPVVFNLVPIGSSEAATQSLPAKIEQGYKESIKDYDLEGKITPGQLSGLIAEFGAHFDVPIALMQDGRSLEEAKQLAPFYISLEGI